MPYNSPYGVRDIHVPEGAFELQQEDFKSQKDGRHICRPCFFGLHSHESRPKTGITEDSQDCKIVLWKWNGAEKVQTGQCCCTWSQDDNELTRTERLEQELSKREREFHHSPLGTANHVYLDGVVDALRLALVIVGDGQ